MTDIRGTNLRNEEIYLGLDFECEVKNIKEITLHISDRFELTQLSELIDRLNTIKDAMVDINDISSNDEEYPQDIIDEVNDED